MHIDHITLRTAHLEETKDFMISVFDLTVGPRPAIIAANIAGYWLYDDDAPLVHLIRSSALAGAGTGYNAEAIDHIAFYMQDEEAFIQKLARLKVSFSRMELPDIGENRVFLHTPTNILLETVFRKPVV